MFEQAIIAITGALSIWLTQDPRLSWQRWAPIAGLVGQPFWLVATWASAQWGMFALTLVFTAAWLRGLNRHWLEPWRNRAAKPAL